MDEGWFANGKMTLELEMYIALLVDSEQLFLMVQLLCTIKNQVNKSNPFSALAIDVHGLYNDWYGIHNMT